MVVVRYAALAALVVWLGALQYALLGDALTNVGGAGLVCAGVLLLALLTMKVLGPPPRAFFIRLPLVLAMLVLATMDWRYGASPLRTGATAAIGFGLLVWYIRE